MFLVCVFDDKLVESHSEVIPAIVYHAIAPPTVCLQCPHTAVDEAEVQQGGAQSGAQPQWAYLAVHLLENEDAARCISMESCLFDDADQGICVSVAIHVARTEAVDGVGQSPIVEPVETIAYLAETVGFASSFSISFSMLST